jgi:hypothetical protein
VVRALFYPCSTKRNVAAANGSTGTPPAVPPCTQGLQRCTETYAPCSGSPFLQRGRDRDLGALVAALLARLGEPATRTSLHRAAARALFGHRFPLNMRELEQALRAAVVLRSASSTCPRRSAPTSRRGRAS